MRVLVISSTFPPMKSGGGEYAFHFCRHLASSGLEVHVVTSGIENVRTDPGMSIYPVMRDWSWKEFPRLMKLARRIKPDVINLHFSGLIYNNQPMITFALSLLKRKLPHTRVVTLIEYPTPMNLDDTPYTSNLLSRATAHWVGTKDIEQGYGTILRDSDSIIVLSGTHSDALSKHLAGVEAKCILIPPPPLLNMSQSPPVLARQRGREQLKVEPDEFLLIYFGYVYPGKGIETLLEAVRLVLLRSDKVRLVIVGGTNEIILKEAGRPQYVDELKDLTVRMGIAHKVAWTGYYPSDTDEPSVYFRSADICVLPFKAGVYLNNSSFSAAAAHGLPIITTRGEVLEPAFIDHDNVLLCSPEEPVGMADAIYELIDSHELRQRLAEGASRLSREWLSWARVMERTIEVFGGKS